ncbi:Mucin-like protein [Lamellibrachia satsuma]|nr:Mucin-like protein [Lamellibrachia satsuma]
MFLYHPRWQRLHEKADVTPKKWCCQLTDNCEYFYRVRPMDRCWNNHPIIGRRRVGCPGSDSDSFRGNRATDAPSTLGWLYGDPHIRTLDGFQYTFNGLGEYTLIETTHGTFTLQCRTAKALDKNGAERDATIFSAFAARNTDSDTIHIGMNDKKDGLTAFVENKNITDWFNSCNVDDDAYYTGICITKKNATQLHVTFTSGISLTIGVSAEQLDITVGAPDTFKGKTKGLMGVFNGDATDDLLPPGENAVPLSNSSTEKTIFDDFGERWRIDSVDSLFYYAHGESYVTYARTDFKPLFIEDVLNSMTPEQRRKAKETCGDNKECIFDFVVTANASPNITVETEFNATVGMESILSVGAFDVDGDEVTIKLESSPDGATFDGSIFKWTPVNMEPVNIS